MTTGQIALIITAVFGPGGLVLAAAAWLNSQAAHRRVDTHVQASHGAVPPSPSASHSAL